MLESFKGEILSPVGSWDMLYAAVRSGADAVYLGAKDFSARRNAENFNISDLKAVAEYCHIRNVRVYLTLNILIKDNEFADAVALANSAYNAGIDGIIIQDLGLAKVLHTLLPELPLHASTQMSIHSVSALPILKELGFTQVVLAREMSLDGIAEFCKKAKELDITVEVFVHGALCMSVSGQCLLSAFLGSRSGNRGLCAGPCRLPFKAKGGTGYDLSLKDLSLTQYIPKLYELGVRSFKIEGRMKRPEYVAAATKACKSALVNGFVDYTLAETLKNVFSRSGFTAGYLENKLGKDMFGIRTKEDVVSADSAFPYLHEIYRKELSAVPIYINATVKADQNLALTLSDGENTVTACGEVPQTAKNRSATAEDIEKNLTKFGDTPYFVADIATELDDGLFVPASVLNALRRDATALLDQKRAIVNRTEKQVEYNVDFETETRANSPDLVIRVERPEQIPQDLSGVKAVILPLENDFEKANGVANLVDIPRGILNEKAIADRLFKFKEKGIDTALCGNIAAIEIAKNCGFRVIADTGLNVHNSETAKTVSDLGAKAVVLSPEMTLADISSLSSPVPKGIITYGNIPLMLFKNCPIKNGIGCKDCDKKQTLTDRKGIEFPVRCRMGYSELLNSVPLWLADRKSEITGIDFEILYFTNESPEQVEAVLSAYKSGLPPITKHTRGLYYRGTI